MSLSIDAEVHMVCNGPGSVIKINAHFYNNTKGDTDFSPSRATVQLLNAGHSVVEDLCVDETPGLMDNIHLLARQTYDFEIERFTKHDLNDGKHFIKVTLNNDSATCEL